jgi:fibronectin-binding autotransporter adhesin
MRMHMDSPIAVMMAVAALMLGAAATVAGAEQRTWTGKGANANWTTPRNWASNVAPRPGDALRFPDRAARSTNVNDFPAGTTFGSLTFTGDYTISGNALGPVGMLTLHAAAVAFNGDVLTLGGPVRNVGLSMIVGKISLGGASRSFVHADPKRMVETLLTIEAVIVDGGAPAGLIVDGLALRLNGANTYSGPTTVTRTFIEVGHELALGSPAAGTELLTMGSLLLYTSVPAEPLTMHADASPHGSSNMICREDDDPPAHLPRSQPTRTWGGPLTLEGNWHVTSMEICRLVLGGPLSGTGTFRFGGNVELTADSPFSGLIRVTDNALVVNGAIPARIEVDFSAEATLAGQGRVGPVTVTRGIVSPGLGEGTLRTASITFKRDAVLQLVIVGPTGGRLAVTGEVTLDNATLELSGLMQGSIEPGQSYVIVDNDGDETIKGTFKDLPEGASISRGGVSFRISYVGGTGNDITLTTTASSLPR